MARRKRRSVRRRRNPVGRSSRTGRFTRARSGVKRVTRRRRIVRRRRNPGYTTRRRRTTRRRIVRRRRNPLFSTNMSGKNMAQSVLGGLIGVAAAKFIPNALPINLGGGSVVRTLITGVSAYVAKMAADRILGKDFGDAVLFGGLMQTGSVALNAFLPSLGSYIGLSGMGELVNTGGFVLPQNPVLAPAIPAASTVSQNGLDRAWGRAF